METAHDSQQESGPAAVVMVIGEPAIIINGVPNVPNDGTVPVCMDKTSSGETEPDPCFGEWLEGRKVRKLFGKKYYSGTVTRYDNEVNWYRVVYEDGDSEDLEWHELEAVLLPLDISIPLKILATQRWCKPDESASESGLKPRTNHIKSAGSARNATKLPRSSKASGEEDPSKLNNLQSPGSTGNLLAIVPKPEVAEFECSSVHEAAGEGLTRQREVHRWNVNTARAEKQKRWERSCAQSTAPQTDSLKE